MTITVAPAVALGVSRSGVTSRAARLLRSFALTC
jgi:hypothetical protein